MDNAVIVAGVFLSGVMGAFLLYLAELRTVAEGSSKPQRADRTQAVLTGCILLSGGAIAAFQRLFYQDSAVNIVNTLLLCGVLWPCAWADVRARVIPNQVLLYGALIRCGTLAAEMLLLPAEILPDLLRSIIAAITMGAAAILCRLVVPKSLGFGDVKLLMLMGFFLGLDRVWGCIFFAILASFLYSVVLLLTKRATMKTEIPYAPFLLLGTIMASFLVTV